MKMFSDKFGNAINGRLKVTRKGWNGKDMWVTKWLPGTYPSDSKLFENSLQLQCHAMDVKSKKLDVCSCLILKAADGSIVFGWLASQTDMDADDWEVVD